MSQHNPLLHIITPTNYKKGLGESDGFSDPLLKTGSDNSSMDASASCKFGL